MGTPRCRLMPQPLSHHMAPDAASGPLDYLFEAMCYPVATPGATVTTSGLKQVKVPIVTCASTPDVATCARRHGGQKLRYKDTLKKSLKQLQINAVSWEDLTQDRPVGRRSMKPGSAIYEANQIAAAKAKRAARKSPAPRTNTVDAQAFPTCPRCQRIFRA
ncbi:unnamed protein product [Schistocephalus solidus]|uniref:Uncharacterized protein n=1 Tax=Schistocephalus solidus TaxID=70667 RepID=A0A183TQ64_SCHSO|nr:unnamed protein product [Schistocephalus solidus]